MPKIPKGKVGVFLYIDKRIWQEFRRLAFMKHENFHGALSYEVNEALRNWILLHYSQHRQNTHKINPVPKVHKAFMEVKKYLKEKYGMLMISGQHISRRFLVEAIMATRGTDPRTVRKWIKLFLQYKLIKHINGELYEII